MNVQQVNKTDMNRRDYVKPQMQVFSMKAEGSLLTASSGNFEADANDRSDFGWDDEDY